MFWHCDLTPAQVFGLLRTRQITLAGNARVRIFGRLDCRSGRRMLRQHRVFFVDEAEALAAGYRPCAHCLRPAYRRWRAEQLASAAAEPAD